VLLVCLERTHYHRVSWTCFFKNIVSCASFLRESLYASNSLKFSTDSTRMIRIEADSSIPYLGFHWDLSSSLKSVFSEAGLYNIIPNIPFYRNKCALFSIFCFLNRCVSLNIFHVMAVNKRPTFGVLFWGSISP
jgi:hypothetical protein